VAHAGPRSCIRGGPVSLHIPLGEDGDSELGDLIEDSEAIQPGEAVSFILLQEQLHSVLGMLSEREAGVVSMRFGLADGQPKTLDEIGKVYGVTRERIRQIESKTMCKLRHPSRSKLLRDYLDRGGQQHQVRAGGHGCRVRVRSRDGRHGVPGRAVARWAADGVADPGTAGGGAGAGWSLQRLADPHPSA
jgi:Sigma-70, region 4